MTQSMTDILKMVSQLDNGSRVKHSIRVQHYLTIPNIVDLAFNEQKI